MQFNILISWVQGRLIISINHQVEQAENCKFFNYKMEQVGEIGTLREQVEEGRRDNRVITQRFDQEAEKNSWSQEKILELQVRETEDVYRCLLR